VSDLHAFGGLHDDHNYVETPSGTYPLLPDTDQVVPIHWVNDVSVLMPGGHWTPDALEAVIGKPGKYASRIVRLFAVLPGLSVGDLNISEMANMLNAWAVLHGLSVKVTYYPRQGGSSEKVFINTKNDEQQWVSIDILADEVLVSMAKHGDPGTLTMNDMHLYPGNLDSRDGYSKEIDIHTMAPGCGLRFPRNTKYDYNTLVVHDIVDGEPTRTEYPINLPGYRAS
jgi:hypothetical protein